MEQSAGGAKGIESFSNAISAKYLPSPRSIEYEGIFFNYYFQTGVELVKDFSPRYSYAICRDPLSGVKDYFISVGLTGKLDGEGLHKHGGRRPLNLVMVMDVSGSMASSFDGSDPSSKLTVAKDSLLGLMSQLKDTDRFGLITFDQNAYTIQELELWKDIDKAQLKDKIVKLDDGGSTCLIAGMKAATQMIVNGLKKKGAQTNENRVFYFTDMNPNMGTSDCNSLLKEFQANAKKKIYTTFVGIGVDFDTDMVSVITKTRACNYFTINNPKEFKKLMSEEFDYIVTPNVFNIKGKMDAKGWTVERVFGSPGYEIPKGGLLYQIDSSFPSLTKAGETKGGVILIKLKKDPSIKSAATINFTVEYETREGKKVKDSEKFVFGEEPKDNSDFFQNSCVRKAVLLERFVSFLKHYLNDENNNQGKEYSSTINTTTGITAPPLQNPDTKHQSFSCPMRPMIKAYKELFTKFIAYFEKEVEVLEDPTLANELTTLSTLIDVTETDKIPPTDNLEF